MDLPSFENVLTGLLSDNNQIRQQAEEQYNHLKSFPNELLQLLLHFLKNSQQQQFRNLSAVLLRRAVLKVKDSLWSKASPEIQNLVKAELPKVLAAETVSGTRHKICDCIAEVADSVSETGQWPELLPFIFELSRAPNEGLRESGLIVFGQLASSLGPVLVPHLNTVKDTLLKGMGDPSFQVQLAALTATSSFVQCLSEHHKEFEVFLEPMLQIVMSSIQQKKEEEAKEALELFVAIAETEPLFLRPKFVQVCDAMMMIAAAIKDIDGTIRHLAIEFLVSFAEAKPGLYRKNAAVLQKLIPLLLNYITDIEDDPDWYTTEESEEFDNSNREIAEEALDRLALSLGGKTMVPIVFGLIQNLLASPQWQHRHGALMSISVTGEGCFDYLKNHLPDVINVLGKCFADPHPRVRWAACNTAGQMATDFGPLFQKKFHAQIIPALAAIMDDKSFPKVQAHAACALINFCENCKPKILEPYLDGIVQRLTQLLQFGQKMVQEQAITAIAAVAECSKETFIKYYDMIMPFLKTVLSTTDKNFKKLRGRAMECATLIGVAVGKEKFRADAKDIMQLLATTPITSLEPDDPQISFILQAWTRMCTSLGEEFVPYLPLVMPSLLHSASLPPDVIVTDGESDTPEGFEVIAIGDKQIGIKTSTMEEKATACNMLFCFVSELKEHFFDFVEPIGKIAIPLITFYYHDDVRSASAQTMAPLLRAATTGLEKRGKSKQEAFGLFEHIFSKLIEGAKAEPDVEITFHMVEGLHEIIEIMGENCLSEEKMAVLIELIKTLFTDFNERRADRLEKGRELDVDEEEAENLERENEKEEDLLAAISEVITKLCKYQKSSFIKYVDVLIPYIISFLAPTNRAHDRQIGICVFDDLIEHLGQPALPYVQHILPTLIASITDPDPAVRQAAVYGAGVIAQTGGAHVASVIPELAKQLLIAIQHPESRNEDNVFATENAIGALGKIILYQSSAINSAEWMPIWFGLLPVTEDKLESPSTYGLLCSFVESNHPHLLGAGGQNLPRLLTILVDLLDSDLVDQAVSTRVVNILKQTKTLIPMEQLSVLLNDEQKGKWTKYIS
eukprot:TRINITY_DN1837_c0_g3_i1.p1 TRINITY_DN1837_c0_g3~~TRINITY_DN1837_c0_g3_i1.p1  ORF type:complete len:1076 (-),score=326.43 TRINITY_DN1837_c0_g3_i1:39-3266(-)